jgi:hypothetical protein
MEVQGFLNLISYFVDDPLPNPSPSTLFDFSFSGKSCNLHISGKESDPSFTSTSMEYVSLSGNYGFELDFLVALVTSFFEYCVVCLPLSCLFFCSSGLLSNPLSCLFFCSSSLLSNTSSNLTSFNSCEEHVMDCPFPSSIVSSEWSTIMIRFSFLIEG